MLPDPIKRQLRVIVGDANEAESELLQIFLEPFCESSVSEKTAQAFVASVVNSIRSKTPFDVVIINQNLQDLDGLETTKLVRFADFRGIIIGTSSDITVRLREEWAAAGCNAFLQKPISHEALLKTMMSWVTG